MKPLEHRSPTDSLIRPRCENFLSSFHASLLLLHTRLNICSPSTRENNKQHTKRRKLNPKETIGLSNCEVELHNSRNVFLSLTARDAHVSHAQFPLCERQACDRALYWRHSAYTVTQLRFKASCRFVSVEHYL